MITRRHFYRWCVWEPRCGYSRGYLRERQLWTTRRDLIAAQGGAGTWKLLRKHNGCKAVRLEIRAEF